MTKIVRNYVTVDVNGVPRVVWSAETTKTGDLLVFLHSRGEYMDEGDGAPTKLNGHPISQQRYSIHLSPRIPDMNMIKHTVEANGEKISTPHFTRAMKKNSSFAPLFVRVVPHSLAELKSSANSVVYSIGKYEPDAYNMCFALFVGSAGLDFDYSDDGLFKSKSIEIGSFQLIMLYSFVSFPARHAKTAHFITIDPKFEIAPPQLQAGIEAFKEGLDAAQSALLFLNTGRVLCDALIQQILADPDLRDEMILISQFVDFWPHGYRGSPSWDEMVMKAAAAGKLPH